MSSPVHFPIESIIQIDRKSSVPIYLQIADTITLAINKGVIQPGRKLPGTRTLATALKLHRKTVEAAYEELFIEGWLDRFPQKGMYIKKELPALHLKRFKIGETKSAFQAETGFKIILNKNLDAINPIINHRFKIEINAGFPDLRLAPSKELANAFRNIIKKNTANRIIGYSDARGNEWLRDEFSKYINDTRGLQTTKENIMITRGNMGIFLTSNVLVKPGDNIIVGDTNYFIADITYKNLGAKIIRVPVDQDGINADAIANICKNKKIRLIYITPQFHYPTTVTLSESRRLQLLHLAEQYKFAIIEDDYDYEFHFTTSPVLPLATADSNGMVVYIGSLTKSIAPAFRIGFIIAPQNMIEELAKFRRVVDYQGDSILEQAIAQLFWEGEIKRNIKKVHKIYKERRDYFCNTLDTGFKNYINYEKPKGGLAVWAVFNKKLKLEKIAENALQKGLLLSNGKQYNPDGKNLNAVRLGYGSLDFDEIDEALGILKKVIS